MGTINNSNPLIVIDGIPTDLGLSSLNMADVERVDVLKDASATAIYGSRGANGVVMITSKRGAEGAGKVTVNANWAIQNATKVPDMLNAAQYAALSMICCLIMMIIQTLIGQTLLYWEQERTGWMRCYVRE